MRTFVSRLQEARELEALCQHAVEEVKRITGFGRVKAYRFDAEDNGRPGRSRRPRLPSSCAPAADIPQQARRRDNLIRVIQDANYQPSPLVPTLNPISGTPLDLSFSALRSVSPVHLQYMRNMGTLASMSISIVIRDRLWGLISCHDAQPRQVSYQTRTACELLGRILAPRQVSYQTRNACELLGRILAQQIEARKPRPCAQAQLRQQIVPPAGRPWPTATAWWRAFARRPRWCSASPKARGRISADNCETVGDAPDSNC